jgi:hypothetical protein
MKWGFSVTGESDSNLRLGEAKLVALMPSADVAVPELKNIY